MFTTVMSTLGPAGATAGTWRYENALILIPENHLLPIHTDPPVIPAVTVKQQELNNVGRRQIIMAAITSTSADVKRHCRVNLAVLPSNFGC